MPADSPESTAGSTPTSNPSSSSPSHKSSIAGPVAGGVVGGVVFVALVAVAALLLLRHRRKSVQNNVATFGPGEFLPESKPPLNYQPYAVPMSGQVAPLLYVSPLFFLLRCNQLKYVLSEEPF